VLVLCFFHITFRPMSLSRSDLVLGFVRRSQRFVRWSQGSGVSNKCPESAYTYQKCCSGPECIPTFPFGSPPEHDGCSDVKPEGSSDKFTFTQTDDRLEPRPYGEHKGEPEEQYYGYENRSYETHFLLPLAFSWDRVPLGGVEAALVPDSLLHASRALRTQRGKKQIQPTTCADALSPGGQGRGSSWQGVVRRVLACAIIMQVTRIR
jgi:hypothetical protein